MKTKRNIEIAVLFGLICAVVLSFAKFELRCDDLRDNVLRLHVIANSNSDADQKIKLAVRDAILESSLDVFKDCNNVSEALQAARNNVRVFNDIANDVLRDADFDYKANTTVEEQYFNTRIYDDFTLPAGNYKSLVVNLGESQGENWWCVVFPCVCVPSATDSDLSDSVPEKAVSTAENAEKYKIKFKTAEIYEELKKIFQKN